jgi:hypothetical protein
MTSGSTDDALRRLQAWYHAQCDGDWEHGEGIHIGTLDNPGWTLDVALADTPLADKPFAEMKTDYEHETEWLTCFLRDGKFMGRCGPQKLEEMIAIFLSWAEES